MFVNFNFLAPRQVRHRVANVLF